jgi:lysophospholipase
MFYSNESDLKSNQLAIDHFYNNTLVKAYLKTPSGQLFYAYAKPSNAHTAIVISSGRIEGLDKYKELLWELFNNDFAVFIVDHQGQGRSYRHLKNKHKGYVTCFDDYSTDLHMFNQHVVDTQWQGKKVLLGHSMGGAIAFDYLAHFEHGFSGVFLSAPMLDIYTNSTPKYLAKLIARGANLLGFKNSYALGQTDYNPDEFALNTLTSSHVRYDLFRQAYHKEPLLQLGGVTYGWLHAAFAFISSVDKLVINIPLYIASAEHDEVVDNKAQYKLAKRHDNITLKNVAGAKHELLFERDEIRQPLLTQFYQFCKSV